MRLFGRKAAATPARPALLRPMGGVGAVAGGEWPRSYETQLRDAVLGNPVGLRALRLVSEGAAGVPLYAADEAHGRAEALVTATGLIETVAGQLLLHGRLCCR